MSTQLVPFQFDDHEVRVLTHDDGTPWWVAKDVCAALELPQVSRVIARLDSDEVTLSKVTDALGREQETCLVNEAGLYNLILRSRKPEAKAFKRWVTHEVLPQIRKQGQYVPDKPVFHNPQTAMLIETLQRLDAFEAQQAQQQAQLLALQQQTIQTQALTLRLMEAQQWITIRAYVAVHALAHQMPEADQRAYARWLGTYCLEQGMPMYKAQTADVSWPDERTYHAGTIHATLPGWLARRQGQAGLAVVR